MGKLAILADDLSSCTDCGIQIARDGFQTFVALDQRQDFGQVGQFDVIALDADSRAASPDEAYERMKMAAGLTRPYFRQIYKSMDSTLRGNPGAEIDAVLDVTGFDLAIIAPAYPHYGRTTLKGIHYLHGRRIDETEFASDPQSPVKEADLLKLFSSQSRRKAANVGLEILERGETAVARRLLELRLARVELVVFDAQSEADLDKITLSAAASGQRVLWVGSTGLAGHIAQILSPSRNKAPGWQPANSRAVTLTVAGSGSEITRKQLDFYKQQPGLCCVRMDSQEIARGGEACEREIERCRARLLEALRHGRDGILEAASSRAEIAATQSRGREAGLNSLGVSARIAASLAEITRAVVEIVPLGGLILTGGDTAKAICRRLGARGILILREVEPGIPLARLVGEHEITIVTKAGGFGQADTLVHANHLLKAGSTELVKQLAIKQE